MVTRLYDRAARPLTLGKEVGRGGEGNVFEVTGAPGTLAKIYVQSPTPDRVDKLATMVAGSSDRLLRISAWPTELLFDKPRGRLVGFTMPRVTSHRELHELYSPAHRKQEFPEADWSFLIHTARNLAAAIDTVHQEGHVIGDLNQKGVLVSSKGMVTLIDCDSFQIQANGRLFFCEVGVPDFTPPELQGQPFRGVKRTPNHDNFGLAILAFQLLFMGRHPFSDRYSGPGEDSLETAIRHFRFAYGATAHTKGIAPPPHTLGLDSLPPSLAGLFERAFSEAGARAGRPTAGEWVQAFDGLLRELRSCLRVPIHRYFRSVAQCPWCRLEPAAGMLFFVSVTLPAAPGVAFDLDEAWRRICAIPGIEPLAAPSLVAPSAAPRPLAPAVQRALQMFRLRRTAGLGVGLALMIASAALGPLGFVAGAVVLVWAYSGQLADGGECDRRKGAVREAQGRLLAAQRRLAEIAGDSSFDRARKGLESTRDAHRGLSAEHQRELQALHANVRAAQLRRFLEGRFIDKAKIDGIGPGRKAVLASYGVETAADITSKSVASVPGFGPALTRALLAWRTREETSFRFDPARGIDRRDLAALEQRSLQKRSALEAELLQGPRALEDLRRKVLAERERGMSELAAAVSALAQAGADVSIL